MKFNAQHQGKWVAAKNNKIIAVGKSLKKLMQKVKNPGSFKFSLVPKGYIAG